MRNIIEPGGVNRVLIIFATDLIKMEAGKAHPNYPGNTYTTSPEKKRSPGDLLFLGSRVYFVSGYLAEIIRSRKIALKGMYTTTEWCKSSYRILTLIENCGGKFQIEGLNNFVSTPGPFVFIGNHMSTLETFVLPSVIAPVMEVTFVVKSSLVDHFLFGPVMRARNPIVVSRKDPRQDLQQVLRQGKELLNKGISLIIFPQHTRSAVFNPHEFNSLGIKLAKLAGVKVIPVALKTDFWGNGKIFKDVGPVHRKNKIHIRFGDPFTVPGNGKEAHENVVGFITKNLSNWGAEVVKG